MPILGYNKAVCKYFCEARHLTPILQMRKLKHGLVVRKGGTKRFVEGGIKFRI